MNWLFVLFDTVFAALYSENWFDVISRKLTSRTENIVYQIEAGTFDFHAVSRLLEHIVYLIPIVFALCLVADFFIRSRFVRYSYKDEYQAKKSVWWNWQSQQDAYQALESGNGQMALADHSEVDPNFRIVGAETWTPQPPVTQQPAAAPQTESAGEEEQEEDEIDRSMIEDARQNEIRKKAAVSERIQNRFTDIRDGFTVFGSWFVFFPKAAQRRIAMSKKNRELRKMYAAAKKKTPKPKRAVFEQRDEEAAAEAYFGQDMTQNVVDGEFEQIQPVETGGLDAFTFAGATQTIQDVLAKPEEETAEEPQEPSEEEEEEEEEVAADEETDDSAEEIEEEEAEDDAEDVESGNEADEAGEEDTEPEPEEPEAEETDAVTEADGSEEDPVSEEEPQEPAEEEEAAEEAVSEETGSGQEESGGTDAQEKVPAADAGFGAAAEILRETLAEE